MFILYHQHSARWSGLFNYLFIMSNIGGGGVKFFWRGGHFVGGGGVIANIGGGTDVLNVKVSSDAEKRILKVFKAITSQRASPVHKT